MNGELKPTVVFGTLVAVLMCVLIGIAASVENKSKREYQLKLDCLRSGKSIVYKDHSSPWECK